MGILQALLIEIFKITFQVVFDPIVLHLPGFKALKPLQSEYRLLQAQKNAKNRCHVATVDLLSKNTQGQPVFMHQATLV